MEIAPPPEEKSIELVSLEEAGRRVGRTANTIRRWMRDLPDFPRPVRIGQRFYFRLSELLEWVEVQPRLDRKEVVDA